MANVQYTPGRMVWRELATKDVAQLPAVSDRVDAPHRQARERLEQPPRASADRQPPHSEVRAQSSDDKVREQAARTLEVEHQLRSVVGRG